ncbi:hypothetical protein Q7P35_002857 [Cladosporium inversicolor]
MFGCSVKRFPATAVAAIAAVYASKRPQRCQRDSGGSGATSLCELLFNFEPFSAIKLFQNNEMIVKVQDSTHDGNLSAQAAESSVRQNSLSLGRLAFRLAVVLAIGFNIYGFGAVYDTIKTLVYYLHDIESLSAPETPSDVAIYICSGILLATGFYFFTQRMMSTTHGAKSPIQKSKQLRYASIALCALWAEQDGVERALMSVKRYASGEDVTRPGALFAVCGEFATALQMGLVWCTLISKAFGPSKQQVARWEVHNDMKQSAAQSV